VQLLPQLPVLLLGLAGNSKWNNSHQPPAVPAASKEHRLAMLQQPCLW
jgi:hypothetical protein